MSRPPIPLLGVRTSSLKKLECAKAGVAYSPQCRQRAAILVLQLQTIMHRKRAIYSSNSSIFKYRSSGHNKSILLTRETSCHNH